MKILIIAASLFLNTHANALPGSCYCAVKIDSQSTPGSGSSVGTKLTVDACKAECSNYGVGNLECGQTAYRWYRYNGGNWNKTNSNTTTANCPCPVTEKGDIVFGNAYEVMPADCGKLSYRSGKNGAAPVMPNAGDARCPTPIERNETCYRTLGCQVQGQDYCVIKIFSGPNFKNVAQSNNIPYVCADGFTYRIDASGKKDGCTKKLGASLGVGVSVDSNSNLKANQN